jgi:hypothetical protein
MWFPIVQVTLPKGSSTWDTNNSLWDNDESRWDVSAVALQATKRYAIFPINGADKVAQQIKITLLAFLGEWFLDVTFGVPYLEDILVKTPHMAAIETILRTHITDVPHVLRFESFSMEWDRARRILGVNFVVVTDYGPITDSFKLDVTAHV